MEVIFEEGDIFPTAISYSTSLIRSLIPSGVSGAYVLIKNGLPFYVGRSDTCLMSRLCSHNYMFEATHVYWEVCGTVVRSYHQECYWYTVFLEKYSLKNKIKPARPIGVEKESPFLSGELGIILHIV